MNSISLDNAYLLLLAVPLIVLFTVPFALAIRKENRNAHNIASQIMHVFMAVIIAFAAAAPSITTVLTETDVYVVADVSYSAKRNLDTIDSYIRNLELPRNTKLGLVCFGKTAELVSDLDDPKKVVSVKKSKVDDTETNIAEALTYTGTLFKTGVIKRIVLITDGKQSDLSNDNAIRRAVDGLVNQNIKVDAIFLDDNPSADSREVQISGVEFTQTAYLNSEQEAVVEVQSSYETEATISLLHIADGIYDDVEVTLSVGRNNIGVPLKTSDTGTFDYEVSVYAAGDANDKNNTYSFTQTVSDEMKVLVITQKFADCISAVNRYGTKCEIDVYENDLEYESSLKDIFVARQAGKENINIHLRSSNVPYTVEELCRYDEIVLSNVDITTLANYSAFVGNLDSVVSNYGKSLVTFGNLNIQSTESEDLMRLADMLPVEFGNSDSKLFTIIIDTSRSMMQLDHLSLTKQVVSRIINDYEDEAYVTIITFNSDAEVIQPVTPLSKRAEILEKVEKLEVIQGTVLGAGLNRTKEYILPLNYDNKQVLLITDGMSYTNEVDDPVTIAKELYAAGVITNVFDVGRQGDEPDGKNPAAPELYECYKLLSEVAEEGHGKHFYGNNAEILDDDLFSDVTDGMTATVIEQEATVSVQRLNRDDPVLEGIDALSIPSVEGYVYGKSKPSATTVLNVNHKRSLTSDFTVEKPLYAYQNYGKGKVSTFTSSLGGTWVAAWDSKVGNAFYNNLFKLNIPEEKHSVPYSMEVIREGKVTRIEVQPATLQVGATAKIEVTLADGETVSADMRYNGALYYYVFDTADVGKYDIKVTYSAKGDYVSEKTIYVCYLDEYDAFSVFDSSSLHRALDGRGTVSEDGTLKLVNDDSEIGKSVTEFTVPLLILAAVLYVVDVAVRKLKWEDIISFFGIGKSKKKEGNKEGNKL